MSARGGVWRSLPDPTVGRFRTSPTGLVFWYNPGPHGHGYADTDRLHAFSVLSEAVRRLDLPEAQRLFGGATEYESAPLKEAIGATLQARPGAWAIVPMRGEPTEWELADWPLTPSLGLWTARGRRILLACDGTRLAAADPLTRRRVVLWAERHGAELVELGALDPRWLAVVVDETGGLAWASAEAMTGVIGTSWGTLSSAPVVRGPAAAPPIPPPLDVGALLREAPRETIVEIGDELDGLSQGFGARLRALLCEANPEIARALADPCTKLVYRDRYLFSPTTARLVTELVAGFAAPDADIDVQSRKRPNSERKNPAMMRHNWRYMEQRRQVIEIMLASVSPRARFSPLDDTPHRRTLTFEGPSGAGTIYFDQGMGAWEADGEFDFTGSAGEQAARLGEPFRIAGDVDGTFVAVRLTETP